MSFEAERVCVKEMAGQINGQRLTLEEIQNHESTRAAGIAIEAAQKACKGYVICDPDCCGEVMTILEDRNRYVSLAPTFVPSNLLKEMYSTGNGDHGLTDQA